VEFTETKLKGAFVIDIKRLEDERGFFARTFCKKEFEEHGLNPDLVQANLSFNHRKGTLRGLHYQKDPHQEAKLVRCARGALYDVIVDLRPASSTYKEWVGVELKADEYRMLYVPEDFAHGFITLQDHTEAVYQVSQFYTPGAEQGIRYDDPVFNISWPMEPEVISDKDSNWEPFQG